MERFQGYRRRACVRRRGFTLVEILVVLAIVGVLAGLTFSVASAVRNRTIHTVCATNLHQLGTALHLYANDHDGWVPPATTSNSPFGQFEGVSPAELEASPRVLVAAMHPYAKNDEIWFCPADPHRKQDVRWLGQKHLKTSYFFYPQTDGDRKAWPPKMQIGRDRLTGTEHISEDIPLFSDATGLPHIDSDPAIDGRDSAVSNHPDNEVNAIRHDLSLVRKSAKFWMGSDR
ncbi:prepilin-type N-terminal cleavage/methylation domain-containing protein [bacterium]|nr:MAG: prepilin-type N-terminal cleavage/methylation domain-containing protein [bacterium]